MSAYPGDEVVYRTDAFCDREVVQPRANVQYIRFRDHFFLLATLGQHHFFQEESGILDCRVVPLKFGGYAIGYRGGHAQVRIERGAWKWLRSYYVDLATKRSVGWFATEFRRWPYEPYVS